MDKKAQGNTLIWVIVIAAVLVWGVQSGMIKLPAAASSTTTTPYISTGATTLSFAVVDAAQPGTTVGATPYISINGAPFQTGITSASPGNTLKILYVNNTAYHNAYVDGYVVPNAPSDVLQAKMNKNASVSITAFGPNNENLATNNYSINPGQSASITLKMSGTSQASTQDMLCILEESNSAKVKRMSLGGFGAVDMGSSKPKFYTLSGVNSVVQSYKINPLTSGDVVQGSITVDPETSQDLSGSTIKITCYTYEYFIDSTTGQVKYDVQDSLGNLKSIASYSFTATFE